MNSMRNIQSYHIFWNYNLFVISQLLMVLGDPCKVQPTKFESLREDRQSILQECTLVNVDLPKKLSNREDKGRKIATNSNV